MYHALRIEWPPDTDSAAAELAETVFGSGSSSSSSSSSGSWGHGSSSSSGSSGSSLHMAGGPLAALFPRLRHLSAGVTPGPAGRSGGERWGYLAGAGGALRSLHLRAATAEDLTLQVRGGGGAVRGWGRWGGVVVGRCECRCGRGDGVNMRGVEECGSGCESSCGSGGARGQCLCRICMYRTVSNTHRCA